MKTKSKKHKSVAGLVDSLTDDTRFKGAFEQELSDKAMAKTLFAMRCAKGITQEEMADKIGCTQGRISKLEHADNDTIKIGDLTDYAKALGLNLSISFQEEMGAVDSIKYHAFQIQKHLDRLAQLTHRDDEILNGVRDFFNEYLFNMLNLFKKSAGKLPKTRRKKRKPVLDISMPETDLSIDETSGILNH